MTTSMFISKRLANPFSPGIKVNLYRDYEYRALARAVRARRVTEVETVMIGDSYFMTHLGRTSTQLSASDRALAVTELPRLVAEVRAEIDRDELGIGRPLLMADMPDMPDASNDERVALIERFREAGADIIKIEISSEGDMKLLPTIHGAGMQSAVHIGFTPQTNDNRTYGVSGAEVRRYSDLLRCAARRGASFVIFERLTEVANGLLTRQAIDLGVVPYSIFSGRAPLGGQSLNIWDSVVKHDTPSVFFPPTACLDRATGQDLYHVDLISDCIGKLMTLTVANVFPPSPRNRLGTDDYLDILAESA